jgi:predicted DNA binding CopG/RHH family protein
MKREKLITIRVSESELEQIRVMAGRRRKSVAEYLRWLVDRDESVIGSDVPQHLG